MRLGDISAGGGLGVTGDCGVGQPAGGAPSEQATLKAESEARMARLVRTIEGEIVPRLVLARRVVQPLLPVLGKPARAPDEVDVRELVRLLLAHDVGVASAYVETVRQRGATLESVCLCLLAPAARELGLLWEEDECDFMQVTVGLCRLHQLLRELSPEFRAERKVNRNVLLAPVPGDQHTFGITLVAQFLRRAGWEVWHEFPTSSAELLQIVRQNWFTVVGLSVGSETRVDDVAAMIVAIRQTSRNRSLGVLLGGPVLVARPELAAQMGADATACDGPMAVLRAEHMCTRQSGKIAGTGMDGHFFLIE
jgi:methanogenic corrinoid protein MtbC1